MLMAKSLAAKGIIALAFDFRGCGRSDGNFIDQTHLMGIEDGDAAVNFLLGQNVEIGRIGIQGSSFGGYVAAMLLDRYPFIKSLVLRVPAVYADSFLDTTVSAGEEKDFFGDKDNWVDASSYKKIAKFKGDLLVIQSEKDELIPQHAVRKYYDIALKVTSKKYFVQKNARHSIHDNPKARKEFNELTVKWFLETL